MILKRNYLLATYIVSDLCCLTFLNNSKTTPFLLTPFHCWDNANLPQIVLSLQALFPIACFLIHFRRSPSKSVVSVFNSIPVSVCSYNIFFLVFGEKYVMICVYWVWEEWSQTQQRNADNKPRHKGKKYPPALPNGASIHFSH